MGKLADIFNVSYSVNSLKGGHIRVQVLGFMGGYMGDYIGDYYRGY